MPPLGPLAESEELLTEKHIRSSIRGTLAPRHLRNHFRTILTPDEFALVQRLVRETWEGVELHKVEYELATGQLSCCYNEGRYLREIEWAGQGLQVWFQIITHMVRFRQCQILILDEPEINLHAEKQNDLIGMLREYHNGSIIIATHSVELMNNVDVSHIIHVQKKSTTPVMKLTTDRAYLDMIRSRVGSNFNLVASQFENVSLILFTEDREDFRVIDQLGKALGFDILIHSVPLHGFSEYKKAIYYRDAYEHFIGRVDTRFTVVLDRDYYPSEYLLGIQKELARFTIQCVFTPWKELENIFLTPELVENIIKTEDREEWEKTWTTFCDDQYSGIIGSATKLGNEFTVNRRDLKVVTMTAIKDLDKEWKDPKKRYRLVPGKRALGVLRQFAQKHYGINLSTKYLIDKIKIKMAEEVAQFVQAVYQGNNGASSYS